MITYEAFILIVCVRKKGKADTKLQYIIVCFCSRSIILNISIVLIENHEKGFFSLNFTFPFLYYTVESLDFVVARFSWNSLVLLIHELASSINS